MEPDEQHLLFRMPIVPTVAKRGRHTLILLQNSKGNFLLGAKNLYPANIYRMVGGGMEEEEDSPISAQRELQEETGISASLEDLTHLATVYADLEELNTGKTFTFITYVFFYDLGDQQVTPSDDLDGIAELSEEEYTQLIQRYAQLSPEIDEDKGFAWSDYGLLYGKIHQIALDALHHVQSVHTAQ